MEHEKKSKRGVIIGSVAVGAVVLVVALAAFQPWKLFTNTVVDEASPFAAATAADAETTVAPTAPSSTASPPVSKSESESTVAEPTNPAAEAGAPRTGTFAAVAHPTTGAVTLGTTPDGRQALFIEDLATDNGPDLKVVLSTAPAGSDGSYGDGLDLGPLKGNQGSQSYDVPDGTDLDAFASVVIWCDRFSVAFGVAPLSAV